MPATRIPIDGLWRCLCPSIDAIAVSRPLSSVARPRSRPIQRVPRFACLQAKSFHSTHKRANQESRNDQKRAAWYSEHLKRTLGDATRHALGDTESSHAWLDSLSFAELHDYLRSLRGKVESYDYVVELVDYMIRIRGEKPALIHYDALVRANAHAMPGSAAAVRTLLAEMKELGIAADSGVYHAALQVLAIHPDYVLRNEIMQEMKERWLGLSPEGWHSFVTGLIRDRQYEMAMDKLEEMHSDQILVQPWLYDIFTFQLCETGELDEAFNLLKYRFENTRKDIQPSVWYFLFDAFSSALHYEGAKFVWDRRVETSDIVLSDGMLVSAINLAARFADPELATSAIRILSERRSALAAFHYEALITAYAGAHDFKTAFRILNIMGKANIEVGPSTTRPLYLTLCKDDTVPCEAWDALDQLFEDGQVVPVAAANVTIEASIAIGKLEEAIEMYKKLHEICASGPNTETFNVLLQGASHADRKDLSMFLASEMRALGIPADNITYDRLILACLKEEDFEDAFRYLEEMIEVAKTKDANWWMRGGTAVAMVKRCVASTDDRVWGLLDEMKERGTYDAYLWEWAERNWKGPERIVEPGQPAAGSEEGKLRMWGSS